MGGRRAAMGGTAMGGGGTATISGHRDDQQDRGPGPPQTRAAIRS